MIIRKGGYFPKRLLWTIVASIMLTVFFLTLLISYTDIWFLLLYPIISAGLAIRFYYKNHIRFGEKISINKNRITLEIYGSTNKKAIFRRGSIKALTCTISGLYYHFKIYKTDNSYISFSIHDSKNQNPLAAIIKFANLKKELETTSGNEIALRYWSKSSNNKRQEREIENVSTSLYEYRSEYFEIVSDNDCLSIQTNTSKPDNIYIDTKLKLIQYSKQAESNRSITFDEIISIEKSITETAPIKSTNQITIKVIAHLHSGESIEMMIYKTHESIPAQMEIIEMNKDFNNLVAIIDMNIKASIDEGLDRLDLNEVDHSDDLLKLKSLDMLDNLDD